MQNHEAKTAAELLAEWRIAGRDTVAARAAANVAAMSLEAATAAEAAANEVEAAAKSALDSVEKARAAVARAKLAATQAAEAARLILAGAEGDKVRANLDVEVAEEAEGQARDAFHEAERRVRDAQSGNNRPPTQSAGDTAPVVRWGPFPCVQRHVNSQSLSGYLALSCR